MDRSADRLATIDGLLLRAGVAYQRFPAFDGKVLDVENDPELRRLFDLKAWVAGHHRNPTKADIGCYLSHYRAIQAFLAQGKPYGLIFEDDADIPANFIEVVSLALDDAREWDILKLHVRHPGPLVVRREYRDDVSLCSFLVRHAGGTAYLINCKAAAKMLEHMTPARRMIDWTYDEGHRMNLRVRTFSPMLVHLQPVPTTRDTNVGKNGWLERQTDRPILPRLGLPLKRGADDAHRLIFNVFNDGGLQAMLFGPSKRNSA